MAALICGHFHLKSFQKCWFDAVKQASSPKLINWPHASKECERDDVGLKSLDYKLRFAGKPTSMQRSSVHNDPHRSQVAVGQTTVPPA